MAKMTLRAARINAGLKQKEAADKLGVNSKTLCYWEQGRSFPNVEKVKRISSLYNIAYDDLIFLPSDSL